MGKNYRVVQKVVLSEGARILPEAGAMKGELVKWKGLVKMRFATNENCKSFQIKSEAEGPLTGTIKMATVLYG